LSKNGIGVGLANAYQEELGTH